MSFLDDIDNNNMLATLLGLNTQTAVQTNGGEGAPLSAQDLPQSIAPAQQQNPGYTIQTAGRQPGMPTPSPAPSSTPTAANPPPMPPADFMDGQTEPGVGSPIGASMPVPPAATPAQTQPQSNPAQPQQQSTQSVPLPTPDPRAADANVPMPPADPRGIPPTAAPASAAPIAPAAAVPPGAPAPAPQRDGLFSQLSGIQPTAPNKWGQFVAGVGKGLSAVGNLPRGASAGQAIAAGAGGGMQGAYAAGQNEQQEFFKNTIAADNQVLKGKKFPYDIAHEQASTNYLNGGAQQRLQNAALGPMGKVYGSWLQSDVGRLKLADQAFDAQEKRNIQYLQEKNKAGVDTTQDWKTMESTREQRKAAVYKQYGINDPNNIKGSQKNPIDASTMTPEQIERAPEGTYFKYTGKDGKSVVAPRDYNAFPNRFMTQAGGNTGISDYAATQAALAGGGAQ